MKTTDQPSEPSTHNKTPSEQIPLDAVPPQRPLSFGAKLWKLFKLSTRILIYIPLLLLIIVAVLLGTPIGARISVMLADQFVPDLDLEFRSGTINKQLEFDYARWSMDGVSVEVEDLSLSWLPTCLFNKQICVDKLHASAVRVHVATDEFEDDDISNTDSDTRTNSEVNVDTDLAFEDVEDTEPSPLILPVTIGLNDLDLKLVEVSVNDMRYNASALKAKALWNEQGLRVDYLHSQDLLVDIPLSSEVDTKITESTEVSEWAMAALPTVYMTFPVYVNELIATQSTMLLGKRQDKFESITLTGSYVEYLIDIQRLEVRHDYGEAKLIGDISLIDDYPMAIDSSFNFTHVSEIPELTQQKISIQAENGFDDLSIKVSAQGDATIDFEAIIALSKRNMPYQLEIGKAKLQWPFKQAEYFAEITALTSKGDINQHQVIVDGEFLSPFHPLLAVNANLEVSENDIAISKITISSEAGDVEGQGTIDWENDFSWQTQLTAADLQLEKIHYLYELTELNSNITGYLTSKGQINEDSWQITIEDADLEGNLNEFPLTVKGNVQFNDKLAINADNLKAEALGTTLLVNGQADEIWDVDAFLEVPDISQWLPDSRGSISAKIDVTGNELKPIVDARAEVIDFNYAGTKVDKLVLSGHYLPLDDHQFTVNIANNKLSWNQVDLSQILIALSGNLHQQTLQLSTGGEMVIDTLITNQYTPETEVFNTDINKFSISNILGNWSTDKVVNITWDQLNLTGSFNPFCINNPHSHLCFLEQTSFGEQGNVRFSAQGTPGLLLQPLLPNRLIWTGESELNGKVNWSESEKITANVDFSLSEGKFELKRSENDRINVIYDQITLNMALDEKQLISNLSVKADSITDIDSRIIISTEPSRDLSGHIKIDQLDLTAIQGFFPNLSTLDGLFSSDLMLIGNLTDPQVKGDITLTKAAIASTGNPTLIEDINLSMSLAGQEGGIDGSFKMGKGSAEIDGSLSWPLGNVSGDVNIKGEKLAFIQPPLAILDITPDINLTFNKEQFAIKGIVDIPTGEITLVQLAEGGVALSSDVIFKDSISEQAEKTSPYAIVADLNINVGKELSIDGMGLNGKLEGTLKLQQQAFKPPLLFGDIKVNNGSYKFMGQTLTISTGEVQFVGPTEVPNLNIEAIREIKDEDLTAGVRVTGTAMSPVVTLFSSPSKEQAEILSYILTGAGFGSSSSEQNNALMMGAALSLGSQLGGSAINNIGSTATGLIEKFGFSNVQLDANDDGRFAISGYIGEDLMVKYGIGVFNPGYEMTVRYYILSQLYLETVSGTLNQSLDIYYSFDVD
ncbi:translocation/assembly module TamB domain-containing protein [Shewanella donghaensis]|uniref:translocation/assembly module TamB domain-containing protein n=1 Tax=Shewanella donghaensis TaxID=238836 RepID=UPI0011832DCA|nr:translocation/assembly module TamB domain-containing protein [Shewanella donghaensis]